MGILELPMAAATAAAEGSGYAGYGHHMWHGDGHGWFMGPVVMIVVVLLAVVLAVVLIRWLGGAPAGPAAPPGAQGRAPLDILKERFARGEIDAAEYDERRRVLGD